MNFSDWLSIVVVCIFGAISPGPSLSVVFHNTISGGRIRGVYTGLGHGVGITIWASLTVAGIGLIITEKPNLYAVIRYAGSAFLVYLGVKMFLSKSNKTFDLINSREDSSGNALFDGFLIAITNPKIALFFLALFSQFILPNAPFRDKILLASTAGVIDAAWYILVALTLSQPKILKKLRSKSDLLNYIFGFILILVALHVTFIQN